MDKIIRISVVMILSSFSGFSQAALMNVASVEFTVSSLKLSNKLSLSEISLIEKNTSNDLALTTAGATAFISFAKHKEIKSSKHKEIKNDPSYVIDGLFKKKWSYKFPEKSKTELSSLTINLAKISDISSFNVSGYLGKKTKSYLGANFLDINGNSIYKIRNLATAFGEGKNGLLILPNLSGQVSAVPLPPSIWLFGFGLLGMFGWRRKNTGVYALENR